MKDAFVLFWAVMIVSSIAWYSFLLVFVGIKGGIEIFRMIRVFSQLKHAAPPGPPAASGGPPG